MSSTLKVFIEYTVKKESISMYEKKIQDVFPILKEFEATNIQWYKSPGKEHTYIEMFHVPTISHYYGIKKWRNTSFTLKEISSYIDGPIQQWALIQSKPKEITKTKLHFFRKLKFVNS